MAEGEIAFSHVLCQKACLQVIYAVAEHRAASQSKNVQVSKPGARQPRPPTPASAVYVVEKVTDALADVVSAYIRHVAKASCARARHSGRSKTTFYDVYNTLNTMSLLTQSSVRDIAQYSSMQRVEFPVHVPAYPILPPASAISMPPPPQSQTQASSSASPLKRARSTSDQQQHQPYPSPFLKEVPTEDVQAKRKRVYIEDWMPAIPSAYTFVSNPGILAPLDRTSTVSGPEQRRRVEASLARLREAGADSNQAASVAMSQNTVMSTVTANNGTSVNNSSNNPFTANNINNPFLILPRILSAPPQDVEEVPLEDQLEPPREPLELEDNNVESNADVVETKYSISDQKKARVDRILAESGTIMISAGASGNPNTGDAPTPTPAPSTPAGGGGGDGQSQSKGGIN